MFPLMSIVVVSSSSSSSSSSFSCILLIIYFISSFETHLDVWELRQVLEAMGQKPTEEELFQMISEVDENMSGSIDFAEFLKVIENQKERAENFDDESDMIGELTSLHFTPFTFIF